MNDAHPDTFADEPTPRSPRAMLVIAVMSLGCWVAVGVGLWIALT